MVAAAVVDGADRKVRQHILVCGNNLCRCMAINGICVC